MNVCFNPHILGMLLACTMDVKESPTDKWIRKIFNKAENNLSTSTPTIIIASSDAEIVGNFWQASIPKGYNVIIGNEKLQTIWDTLDNVVICLVLDLETFGNENLAFINIIKKIRPKLPVVILSSENKYEVAEKLAEFGIFYRGIKPLSVQEIEHIVEGIDSNLMRNKDKLIASL